MNKITKITRKRIKELFQNGINVTDDFIGSTIYYEFNGTVTPVTFLNYFFDLKNLPSHDKRFSNALEDISFHTINNQDYENGWVFEDKRFNINELSDEKYLNFICKIFDPLIRDEDSCWKRYLDKINNYLKEDGFLIVQTGEISGQPVYSYQSFNIEEVNKQIPFSIRNKTLLDNSNIDIPSDTIDIIKRVIINQDEEYRTRTETGLTFDTSICKEIEENEMHLWHNFSKEDSESLANTNDIIIILDYLEFFAVRKNNFKFNSLINNLLKNSNYNIYINPLGYLEISNYQITPRESIIKAKETVENYSTQATDVLSKALLRLSTINDDTDIKEVVRQCLVAMEAIIKEIGKKNDIDNATKALCESKLYGTKNLVREGKTIFHDLQDEYQDLRHGTIEENIKPMPIEEAEYWINRICIFTTYLCNKHTRLKRENKI